MDFQYDYQEEHELECPHCHKRARHTISDTIWVDIEPPDDL